MVSIIIPVYNSEIYLQECMESIVNQTYRDLEIITIDDGSIDESGVICDEYAKKDNRIVVIHQSNKGQGAARNKGMKYSHGEYIYFMDSDDVLNRCAIELLVKKSIQETAEIVCFDADTILDGFDDTEYFEILKRKKEYATQNGANLLIEQIKNDDFFVCSCLHLFRRDFLENIGFRYPRFPMHEDELIIPFAYLRAKRVSCMKETLYIRRLRAGSIMSKHNTMLSIRCLGYCISFFVREIDLYKSYRMERNAICSVINQRLEIIMDKYIALNNSSKKKILPLIRKIAECISGIHSIKCIRGKMKISYPRLFLLYRIIINKARNILL